MSAYIVEDKTINRIVTFIERNPNMDYQRRRLAKLGYVSFPELGKAMFDLNCQSVEERYGKGEAKTFRDLDYKYRHVEASTIQVLKSLQCYLYQSCEGECEETPLYKALEHICGLIAIHIVSNLPTYDAAEWG